MVNVMKLRNRTVNFEMINGYFNSRNNNENDNYCMLVNLNFLLYYILLFVIVVVVPIKLNRNVFKFHIYNY